MEPKQMLEAVIEKAIKNGFSAKSLDIGWENDEAYKDKPYKITFCEDHYDIVVDQMYISTVEVLFNHDFAKAYYGEHGVCKECGAFSEDGMYAALIHCSHCMDATEPIEDWKFHLTKAVLSEDPLLYYYQHL